MLQLKLESSNNRKLLWSRAVVFVFLVLVFIILASQNPYILNGAYRWGLDLYDTTLISSNVHQYEDTLSTVGLNRSLLVTSNSSSSKSGPGCKPKTHVGFLKTHKTGSSTIFSILARKALSANIPVVVPVVNHLCYPRTFERSVKCMQDPGKQHSMLFNHVRFSRVVKKTIPPDSFWFTILREPLGFFESAYAYFKIKAFTKAVNFEEFLANHQIYLPKLRSLLGKKYVVLYFLQSLEFDLGFSINSNITNTVVIDFMEQNFDLVFVSTYFDHGLCQLKNEL